MRAPPCMAAGIATAFLLLPPAWPAAAGDGPAVDVAIVFLADMSESMDGGERRIVRDSHANAIASRPVLDAIADGPHRRVAMAYAEYGNTARIVVGWSIVDGEDAARRFAAAIRNAPLRNLGMTGIGGGLELARYLFASCPCRPVKRVVDVAGDGKNNTIPSLYLARRALLETGATINGLPIDVRPWDADIVEYFEENVVGGPAAFNLPVTGMDQLPETVRQKILLDLY